MIVNSANLRSLYIGYSTAFNNGFAGVTPQYLQIATPAPSTTLMQEYGWLGLLPGFREWIGDRVIQNIESSWYSLRNKRYEQTVGVDRDHIEDDNLGLYGPLFEMLGQNAALFPDELVFKALLAGFSTPCYDGQYFFDVDHPVITESGNIMSVSNFGGGTGTPWFLMDISRTLKPMIYQERKKFDNLVRMDHETDEDVFNKNKYVYGSAGRCSVGYGFWQMAFASKLPLDASNYEAARIALTSMKGDHGRPLNIQPKLLVCGPTMEGKARQLLKNATVNGGETNTWAGTAEVMVCPWLP